MRSTVAGFIISVASVALGACGSSGSGNSTAPADSGTAVVTDAGSTPTDTGAAAETYPPGPYRTSVGQRFEPFTLNDCDGTPWHFDGPDFFTSNLTVVSIAAGWCVPCQREAASLETQIIQRYAGRGVRFVQILVQNPDHTTITGTFCNTWRTRYGITFPELIDPAFVTQPYVPMTAFPGNIIIDRRGVIRWREYGADMSLSSIRTAVDAVLAAPNGP